MQDMVTPNVLDRQYYKNVLEHTVLFTSDATLLTSEETARMVEDNANIPGWWEGRFAKSMVKLAGVEVKTGHQGQIRTRSGRTVGQSTTISSTSHQPVHRTGGYILMSHTSIL
jgi:hypothetical protein